MAKAKLFTAKKFQGMLITMALSLLTILAVNKIPFLKKFVGE